MGEKAGKRGEREEMLGIQSTCLPQVEGSVCRTPEIREWTLPPSPLQPALSMSFFHFEVPAMWQHLCHLTTGTKGSRRVPFRQQQVAELVSLLACPVLQDGSAHRSQPPGRTFLGLVCSASQPLGRPLACRVSRVWLLQG